MHTYAASYLTDPQVVYSVETFLAYSVGALWLGLANNGMTDEERETLQSSDPEFIIR